MRSTDPFRCFGSLTARNSNYMRDTKSWKFYKSLYKPGLRKKKRMTLSDIRRRMKKAKRTNHPKYQDPMYKIRLYDYKKEPQ